MEPFYTNILVPLDGSELAEKALEPAVQLAAALAKQAADSKTKVKLTLLRVSAPITLMAADPMLFDEMIRMSVDEAHAYLKATAQTISGNPFTVETKVVSGSPADAIIYFVEENGVDLVIMSSHGRTGSSRWVYGSVAEKVMHHAPCATTIIRAHVSVNMFQNRKLLVPLDGSELAEDALKSAMAIAEAVKSDVLLLRVVEGREPLPENVGPAGDGMADALQESNILERTEAETYLQKIYAAHVDHRVSYDVQQTEGDIADAIVSYADANKVDLIVISSHGRSGIGRWLHGSVAEKVLRGADCATMIVRRHQDKLA